MINNFGKIDRGIVHSADGGMVGGNIRSQVGDTLDGKAESERRLESLKKCKISEGGWLDDELVDSIDITKTEIVFTKLGLTIKFDDNVGDIVQEVADNETYDEHDWLRIISHIAGDKDQTLLVFQEIFGMDVTKKYRTASVSGRGAYPLVITFDIEIKKGHGVGVVPDLQKTQRLPMRGKID